MNAVTAAPADHLSRKQPDATRALKGKGHSSEYLTFRIGSEDYGIDILKVQEIRSYEAPTRIANAPDFVKGVVDLRGVIAPVIDLRAKFGVDSSTQDSQTVTIILSIAGRVIGAVIDAVSDVVELSQDQIKPVPEFGGVVAAGCITGIGAIEQGDKRRMIILVDIEKFMTSDEMGLVSAAGR